MKILQVNNVYGEKSTGKITQVVHEGLLADGNESVVVFGRGKAKPEPNVIRLCPEWYGKLNGLRARLTGLPHGGCYLSTLRLMGIIRREKPDVVHLQCINGTFVNIYWLIRWLKKNRIKTVLSLHAEFMYTANCGYAFECNRWKHGCVKCPDLKKATRSILFDRTGASWRKMRDAFRGFERNCIICPVSPWTEERARQSDILKDFRFQTVYNGVDERVFSIEGKRTVRNTVLNVTAYFSPEKEHMKGGWYLMELARKMPDVHFLVAGKTEEIPSFPENITLLGRLSDQKPLAEQYRRAQLSLIVSKRETFSMPCAESLCCGTPVVGFMAGAPERISLPEYSEFVEHGDVDALEKVVRKWLSKENLDYKKMAQDAERAYSSRTMLSAFEEVYRKLWS